MLDNVQEVLDEFKAYVIQQARANLKKGLNRKHPIYASGKLSRSIDGFVKKYKNSISIYFEMEDYGFYQDQGVSGTKKKYDTPYSYKSKMPPPSKLDKWIVRKGIAPRKQGGQFVSRKSLQFLIARSIYTNGIKPSLFFTKPFEAAFKKLPDELIEKYGLDIEQLFESITKDNFKK